MGSSLAVLLTAALMACSTAFVSPKMPVRLPTKLQLAPSNQNEIVDSTTVVKLGGGSELMVARRRRRSSEEESSEEEAQETTRVVEQYTPGVSLLAFKHFKN